VSLSCNGNSSSCNGPIFKRSRFPSSPPTRRRRSVRPFSYTFLSFFPILPQHDPLTFIPALWLLNSVHWGCRNRRFDLLDDRKHLETIACFGQDDGVPHLSRMGVPTARRGPRRACERLQASGQYDQDACEAWVDGFVFPLSFTFPFLSGCGHENANRWSVLVVSV
jgi:hypothetical protein